MTTILVTTADDEVSPGDGLTSLREAVAEANNGDTIVFGGLQAVFLTSQLTISKNITIDGTGGGAGEFYATDISGPIVVQTGADVTLSHLMVSGGGHGGNAADGGDGGEGNPASDGTPGTNGTGGNGGNATNGGNGGNGSAPIKGQDALGGIENDGTLTLDHVELSGPSAIGGDGGGGGKGGAGQIGGTGGGGGSGLNGSNGGNGGNGGLGGNGGDGPPGSNGGDAVAGILNTGNLTIKDSLIHGAIANGGNGGNGGAGGAAGDGGSGGGGGSTVKPSGPGHAGTPGNGGNAADAGNGGNGGNAGDGGNAVAGISNAGTITIVGATILYNNQATAGMAGQIGEHGAGGKVGLPEIGNPGAGGTNTETNAHGSDGQSAQKGVDGSDGNAGIGGSSVSGLTGGAPVSGTLTFDRHFYEFDQTKGFFEQPTMLVGGQGSGIDTQVTLRVEMLGDSSVAGSVGWQIAPGGKPLSDFDGPTSGTLNFTTGALFQYITLNIKPDAAAPRSQSFNVEILNPKTGDVLGSAASFTQNIVNVHPTNGPDKLVGTDFSDVLMGLGGNDRIFGEGGDDVIYGGSGNDTIDGGPGNDFLYGGPGKDVFLFDSALNAATNVDQIRDFSVRADKIELDRTIFKGIGGNGVLAGSHFHIGAHAAHPSDRIIYNPHSGALFYHSPGTPLGHEVEFAIVFKHPPLTHADFLVI